MNDRPPEPSITDLFPNGLAAAQLESDTTDDLSLRTNTSPERLSRIWPQVGGDFEVKIDDPSGPETQRAWGVWLDDELGEVLRHQLNAPIDFLTENDTAAPPSHSVVDPLQGLGESPTLGELLADEAPNLQLLQRVRRFAKPAMTKRQGDLPREVAGVVYFAAIVAALLKCKTRIARLSDQQVRDGAQWALHQPWLPDTLIELFRAGLRAVAEE